MKIIDFFWMLAIQAVAGFDVHLDVDVGTQRVTNNHTNRVFGGHETVPDDMGHDGTALWA